MKKNKFNYVVLFLAALFIINMGCTSDNGTDDTPDVTVVVTTEDFNLTVEEGSVANGDELGEITGATNSGTITFSIASQAPEGALAINSSTGMLTVADETAFVPDNQVTGVINVVNGDITKTANITIDVTAVSPISCASPVDFDIDLSAFEGDIVLASLFEFQEEDEPAYQYQGTGVYSNECAILEVTGDILGFDCDLESVVQLSFTPTDATTGTVAFEENNLFSCFDENVNRIVGSGTYDLSTSTIVLDFEGFQVAEDGELLELGGPQTTTIYPGIAEEGGDGGDGETYVIPEGTSECNGEVDVTPWVGNLTLTYEFEEGPEDDVVGTMVGSAGETCTLTLTGDYFVFGEYGCPDATYILYLIPGESGPESGTVIADEQQYGCENYAGPDSGFVSSILMTGTYDTTTGEIVMDVTELIDGSTDEFAFAGQFKLKMTE